MLPRCGRVAHICEANWILQSVFPAAIAFLETYQFVIWLSLWNKLQIRTRQRGNCSMLAGKSRGGTPFCRMLKTVFPKNNVSRETLWKSFLGKLPESGSARLWHIPSLPWESQLPLKPCLSLQPFWFEGNCDSSDSFLDFCFISLCSLICSANVGCSPTPRQHFWKIVGSKNFLFCLRLAFCNQFHTK